MSTRFHPGIVPGGRAAPVAAALAVGIAAGTALALSADPVLVVAGIVAAAGVMAVIVDADWALVAIAAFAVLRLAEVATEFHGAPSTFQPAVVAIAVGLAVRWVVSGVRPSGGGRALLLGGTYVLVAMASLLAAADVGVGFAEVGTLAKGAAVAVLVGLLLHRGTSLRKVVWTLVAGGGVLASLSLIQTITGAYDSSFLGFARSSVENIVGLTDEVRVSGPVGDANFYAQLLVLVLPLALDRMWRDPARIGRILAGAAAAALTAAIVLTFSRGGALGLIVVGALMLVTHRPKATSVCATLIVVLAALPLLPDSYLDRLSTLTQIGSVEAETDISIRYRTAEIGAAWGMLRDHPLTGVGFGNYPSRYPEYSRSLGIEFVNTEREAHNLALEVGAETGIPGIAAFGMVMAGAFSAVIGARRRLLAAGRTGEAAMAHSVGVALVGYLATSLFLHLDFARLFWLFVGLALAMPNVADHETAATPAEEGVPS